VSGDWTLREGEKALTTPGGGSQPDQGVGLINEMCNTCGKDPRIALKDLPEGGRRREEDLGSEREEG